MSDFSFVVLAKYRRYNKESLRRRLRNFLSTDWLPHEKAKTFPLRGYYVNLDWLKKIKKAMKDELVPMSRIHDLFKQLDIQPQPINILTTGILPICIDCNTFVVIVFIWCAYLPAGRGR